MIGRELSDEPPIRVDYVIVLRVATERGGIEILMYSEVAKCKVLWCSHGDECAGRTEELSYLGERASKSIRLVGGLVKVRKGVVKVVFRAHGGSASCRRLYRPAACAAVPATISPCVPPPDCRRRCDGAPINGTRHDSTGGACHRGSRLRP